MLDAFMAECRGAAGAEPALDDWVDALERELRDPDERETRARRLVERLALALQASLLVRYGDPAVADAFCASRLADDRDLTFGTLPLGVDAAAIVERHRPKL
jgi:putative acyl-CoA dehydrogenase